MLAPGAPHITEELWSGDWRGHGAEWSSIHTERWPEIDTSVLRRQRARSRSRSTASCATAWSCRPTPHRAELERLALDSPKIAAILGGRAPDRIVRRGGGKLLNIVIRDA